MFSDDIRSIQSAEKADGLLMLAAQKDMVSGRVEDLGGGWWRLSDGSVLGRRDFSRMLGFSDQPYCNHGEHLP